MQKEHGPEAPPPASFLGVPYCWVVVWGMATAVTVPIRYGEGIHCFGRNVLFALTVIYLYALFAPCPALMGYGVLFMGVVALKRIPILIRHHFGRRQLSGFAGYPLPCLLGLPYGFCKQVIEPGLIAALGWYVKHANSPLGLFFLLGAGATALRSLIENVSAFHRDTVIWDHRIQMEHEARQRAKRGW